MAVSSEDKLIVWPPCVVVENTELGFDPATKKSVGLSSAEVRSAVEAIAPNITIRRVMAIYNRRGHKGRFLVLFPDSDIGYMSAVALHEAFKHAGRGRDEWLAEDRRGGGGGGGDGGKKELFGYLVEPREMAQIDRGRTMVKNWKAESLQEKVLNFQRDKMKFSKENARMSAELQAAIEERQQKIQQSEEKMDKLRQEIMSLDEAYAAEERQREADKRKYEEKKQQMIDAFEAEKAERLRQFKEKERELREKIDKDLKEDDEELARIREHNSMLETDIRVLQAVAKGTVRAAIAAEAQIVLNDIQQRHQEKVRELRERHMEQKKQLMRERAAKMLNIDSEYCDAQDALEEKMEAVIGSECQICFEEYGDGRPKAFYIACKHAKNCLECADTLWKTNRECPYCRTLQREKPIKLYE